MDIGEFINGNIIEYRQTNFNGDTSINITNMRDLVKTTYKELVKNNNGESMMEWVLAEANAPFEPHTTFVNAFIYTAFKMFEEGDWQGIINE